MTTAKTELDQILSYASHGWYVFPLHWPVYIDEANTIIGCSCGAHQCSIGKHPLTEHGFKDATTDEQIISKWYAAHPDCNWAIETGIRSGIIVCDTDPRHGGDESLRDLEAKYGPLPLTPRVFTGGGGLHHYFKHPGGHVGCTISKIGMGIDLKADGGYVVIPPSMHEMRHSYRWDLGAHMDDLSPAEPPVWLYERENRHSYQVADLTLPDVVPQGARDNTMISYAGTLRNRGLIEPEIYESLQIVNKRFDPPLDERSLHRIAHSAASYDPGEFGIGAIETGVPPEREPQVLPIFPSAVLPKSVRDLSEDLAYELNSVPEIGALAALVYASAAIGRLLKIRLRVEFDETALLWGAIVGLPGSKKTPALRKVSARLRWYDREYALEHNADMVKYRLDQKEWRKGDKPLIQPRGKRRRVQDITIEKLGMILSEDDHGLVSDQDELGAWIGSFNQYRSKGQGADRMNWLSIWASSEITIDRKSSDETLIVKEPFVSVIGSIQPGMLSILRNEIGNDGFLSRFLFVWIPRLKSVVAHREQRIRSQTILNWNAVIDHLLLNAVEKIVAVDSDAFDAYKAGDEWWCERANDPLLDDRLLDFYEKGHGTVLRLALVLQAITSAEHGETPEYVGNEAISSAWSLMRYFGSTMELVLIRMDETADRAAAMSVIEAAKLGGGTLTLRDAQRARIGSMETATEILAAFKGAQDRGLGWVQEEPFPRGKRYTLHVGPKPDETD